MMFYSFQKVKKLFSWQIHVSISHRDNNPHTRSQAQHPTSNTASLGGDFITYMICICRRFSVISPQFTDTERNFKVFLQSLKKAAPRTLQMVTYSRSNRWSRPRTASSDPKDLPCPGVRVCTATHRTVKAAGRSSHAKTYFQILPQF